jgi:formiminotetrahydrofolate cyclodeaminase
LSPPLAGLSPPDGATARFLPTDSVDCERIAGVSRAEELLMLPVEEFAKRVASAEADPGAGAVAAVCASLAAGLVVMVAKGSHGSWTEAGGVAAQADALRRRTASLAGENAGAYEAALELLDRSREGEGAGDLALAGTLEAAAEAPLRVAEQAATVAELAGEAARDGAPELRADAVAAAQLAAAAAHGAGLLVEINLAVGADDPRVERARSLAVSARAAAERALETRD